MPGAGVKERCVVRCGGRKRTEVRSAVECREKRSEVCGREKRNVEVCAVMF